MPKLAEEKSALWCRKVGPGVHAVGGVSGLLLRVADTGAKYWVLRARVSRGKRRDIGIGPFPEIGLAAARDKARELKAQIRDGRDPVEDRRQARAAHKAEAAKAMTFDEAARRYLTAKSAEWKNAKHAAQWRTTLEQYASPVLGDLSVDTIALPHVMKVLEPHWQAKTETMTRVRGRIESILDWSTVHGYRAGDNPARWKGNLAAVLPAPGKVAPVVHHRALPWREVPQFMTELRKREGTSARALEFAILTAARSGEVRGMTWGEVDLERRTWTVPAIRMKASREHVVALSDTAVALLQATERSPDGGLVFPSTKGKPLSDMALTAVMRRMGVGAVPHGMRSAFRDWAGEATHYPREVIEHALAHQLKDKAEAAYARGSLIDKRRALMEDWARHCGGKAPAMAAVVALRR